jgi:NTP pyrophosphatase (non-canonical NTP hydrolase)
MIRALFPDPASIDPFSQEQHSAMDRQLKALARKIIAFRDHRDWAQFHSPKNLSQALGIEAAELQELFLWQTSEASRQPSAGDRQRIESELADIFIYLTYLCHELDVDILQAVERKLIENDAKYPVDKACGNHRKYNQL